MYGLPMPAPYMEYGDIPNVDPYGLMLDDEYVVLGSSGAEKISSFIRGYYIYFNMVEFGVNVIYLYLEIIIPVIIWIFGKKNNQNT